MTPRDIIYVMNSLTAEQIDQFKVVFITKTGDIIFPNSITVNNQTGEIRIDQNEKRYYKTTKPYAGNCKTCGRESANLYEGYCSSECECAAC